MEADSPEEEAVAEATASKPHFRHKTAYFRQKHTNNYINNYNRNLFMRGTKMKKEDLVQLKKELSNLSELENKKRNLYLRKLATGQIQGPPTGYPSIDKPWLKYYSEDKLLEDVPEMSIFQYALLSNLPNMNNVSLDIRSSENDFKMGFKITYKNFFEKVELLAKSLQEIDIKIDEIIPLIVPNVPEARYLIYANSYIGSTSYPISPLLPPEQLSNLIVNENIKTVFLFEGFYEKYKEVLKKSSIDNIILLTGMESLPLLIRKVKEKTNIGKIKKELNSKNIYSLYQLYNFGRASKKNISPYYRKDHIAAIIGTSGTTGTPKGVCLTDKNINAVAMAYKNGGYFEGNFLDALLPSIGYGISMIHYQTVDGRYVYLIPELLTTKFPQAITRLHPDNFPGGPVHYINLVNSLEFKNGQDVKGLNYISGGASLPKSVEQELNSVSKDYREVNTINNNLIVRQGYGLSENTAMGAYNKRGAYAFGSVGIPIIYENVGIFEPGTDNELPYGTHGEICVTGDTVMKEYLHNPEETSKVLKKHGDGNVWIHTKDIGFMDQDGHIFHVDRIKNIFMRYGFNVHPAKIAEFINTIPYVKDCTVIGFEHPDEQAVPIAFIELNENELNGLNIEQVREQLNKMCMQNLEETSIPYDFIFVDQLPINVGGKINLPLIIEKSQIDFMNPERNYCKKLFFNK